MSDYDPNKLVLAKKIIKQLKKLSPKQSYQYLRESRDYLDCVVKREIATLMYAVTMVGVSSTYELQSLLNLSSRSIIENRIVKLMNAGIVSIVKDTAQDEPLIRECWAQIHPNTNKQAVLYAPTLEANEVVPLFSDRLDSWLTETQMQNLANRGKKFKKMFDELKANKCKKEQLNEKSAMDVYGSCSMCGKIIRHSDFKNGKAEKHMGNSYCASCVAGMYQSGKLKLAKRKR